MTEYHGAVLIIGSLWWDTSLDRVNWRDTRLDAKNMRRVYAPIRYGRISESRSKTYTMVFSNSCSGEKIGTALLVPFQNHVLSFEDLKIEATKLWRAERSDANEMSFETSYSWGAVGLMTNPSTEFSPEVITEWNNHYQSQAEKPKIKYATDETPIISDNGLLSFEFPTHIDNNQPAEFDFILATAIKPKPNRGFYPTPERIARACLSNRYTEYFEKNRENGITTFQDDEVMTLLGLKK